MHLRELHIGQGGLKIAQLFSSLDQQREMEILAERRRRQEQFDRYILMSGEGEQARVTVSQSVTVPGIFPEQS